MSRPAGFIDSDRFSHITMERKEALGRIRSEAWVHRWSHWAGRGVIGRSTIGGTLVEMPFVRFYDERSHQRELLEFLDIHREDQLTVRETFPIYGASLDYMCYDVPHDHIPLVMKPRSWD